MREIGLGEALRAEKADDAQDRVGKAREVIGEAFEADLVENVDRMDRDRRARSSADVIGFSPQGFEIAACKKDAPPVFGEAKRGGAADVGAAAEDEKRFHVFHVAHMPSRSDRREAIRSSAPICRLISRKR